MMPMATTLNATRVSQSGVNPATPVAADLVDGNSVPNVSGIQLTVENAGATDITVTFTTSATVEGVAVADLTATVPATSSRTFGRFSRTLFGDSVEFLCSAACNVSATY